MCSLHGDMARFALSVTRQHLEDEGVRHAADACCGAAAGQQRAVGAAPHVGQAQQAVQEVGGRGAVQPPVQRAADHELHAPDLPCAEARRPDLRVHLRTASTNQP